MVHIMNDQDRLRYSRHILLPELAEQGQMMLLDSHVVMVGVGGLGSAVASYLVAAGVGELTLVDGDVVELSNLQRQIVHQESTLGQNKAESARTRLLAINSTIQIHAKTEHADEQTMNELAQTCDVLVDCTDNFPTRFALNRVARKHGVPLVSSAAVRWQGQIAVFMPEGACYKCLYTDETPTPDTCAERGVAGPLLGVMGSMQALETIKLLADIPTGLRSKLMQFDGLTGQWRCSNIIKDPDCPVCKQNDKFSQIKG